MARKCYITVNNLGEYLGIHEVEYPSGGEPGAYVQQKSISAFNERELKRAYPDKVPDGMNWGQYADTQKFCTVDWYLHMGHTQSDVVMAHKSIWEFYEYIGYNYKTKKYIKK